MGKTGSETIMDLLLLTLMPFFFQMIWMKPPVGEILSAHLDGTTFLITVFLQIRLWRIASSDILHKLNSMTHPLIQPKLKQETLITQQVIYLLTPTLL